MILPVRPALAALALLAAPAAAHAADGRCIWALAPKPAQERLIADYAHPEKALAALDANALIAKAGSCVTVPTDAAAKPLFTWRIGALLAGYAKQLGASRDLAAKGVNPQRLEDAWAELGASRRARLIADMPAAPGPADPTARQEISDTVHDAAATAGWSASSGQDPTPFLQYFLGRAVRARMEGVL